MTNSANNTIRTTRTRLHMGRVWQNRGNKKARLAGRAWLKREG
jgi:hypothetical protein